MFVGLGGVPVILCVKNLEGILIETHSTTTTIKNTRTNN